MVMLTDPVAAPFNLLSPLTDPSSIDSETVPVPARLPAVMDMRWLPTSPRPAKHRTDEPDSHSVTSHDVGDVRPAPVTPPRLRLAPCTVMLNDPEDNAFARPSLLVRTQSKLNPSETLPAPICTLTDNRMLPNPDCTV